MNAAPQRVAIVHDYLTQRGGAERVVLSLCRAFPEAPVYTSLYDPETTFDEFRDRDVRPLVARPRRAACAGATGSRCRCCRSPSRRSRVEADVVVCSSSGWAHGIRTDGRKIVYCHSPAKWLYRTDDYLGAHPSASARVGLRPLDPSLRSFDRRAAASADTYIANSTFIAAQIRDVYGIEAEVLCPPPGLGPDGPREPIPGVEPGFLLAVARLLPYKNVRADRRGVPSAARAHARRRRRRARARQPRRESLRPTCGSSARWTTHAAVALRELPWPRRRPRGRTSASRRSRPRRSASRRPRCAGAASSTRSSPDVTGVFFDDADPASIADAVTALIDGEWDADAIRAHAETFSESRFVDRIRSIVLQSAGCRRAFPAQT